MSITNNNVKKIDLPVWELMNQAPTASQAISAMATSEDGTNRYIYYITGSLFYRYDTQTDSWQQLATPNVAPVTLVSLRYTTQRGYHARVLSATSTTVTIGGLRGPVLSGSTMRIDRGTGQGQERTLTYSSETVHDAGIITGTTTSSLADSTKKWKYNQWAGYLVGVTFGTDATQYKKVIYNDTTTLYVADANLMPHDPWNNQAFVAAAPYALPVTTAGSQAHYEIISTTYTVSSWTTIPDYTSFAQIKSGGIYMISSAAAAPFYTLQYYDIAHDSWTSKTCPQSLLLAALGTDATIERLAKQTAYISSTATAGAARSLTDTVQTMTVDRYRNFRIVITGGTGIGQTRRIVANTATAFYVERNWDTNPDATSTYEIHNDFRKMILAGGGLAQMLAYNPEYDFWSQGELFDYGITANISVKLNGWEAIGVSTGARIAAGITTIASAPTAGGTGYTIGDILTCAVGGAGAQVIVTSIAPGGIVTGLELVHAGSTTGYTTGTGKATTGGTGTGCTINITAVGAVALITTATNHFFKNGNSVTFAGCTEAAYNAAHTIIGVNSLTQFSVAVTATANMAATASQSTTTIVDPTQNWTVNEHAGKLLHLMVAGIAPTSQIRWIVSNTANTLTVATITAGVNGTSKYVIYDSKVFGVDTQRKPAVERGYGHASSGSTTTLVDSSKNWTPNQWAGYRFRIDAGTGLGSGLISITSNTETTLTYAVQSFTPDATTLYEIQDTWGLLTASTTTTYTEATTKNWTVNQWAGKRFKLTGGLGIGTETTCLSNTATVLTIAAAGTAGDTTTPYAIFGVPVRGAGIELIHINGTTDTARNGKLIFSPRGTLSNTADIFDITTGRWTYGYFFSPQAELPTTGSYYAYDGADTIYFTKTATGVNPRIFAYNVTTNSVTGGGQISDTDLAATIGNRMEIIKTTDGIKFLYWLQNTGTKMFRAMLWYAQ